jgi:4-amino-4-deoxy-L-arabinose transferase-like glycosyltransferase
LRPTRSRTFRDVALLLATCALTLFLHLGGTRLWDRDEPRNAGCTREMLRRGDWVVPVFNAELRTHKPVLLYWLMMTSYAAFGENEWGARFPSAALGAATVLLTYAIGRRLFNASAGFWGALVLASSLQFALMGRFATPEMLFTFCVTAALGVYVLGAFAPRPPAAVDDAVEPAVSRTTDARPFFPSWPVAALVYGLMGLAVLAKGPAGLVLPTAVIGMFLLIMRLPPRGAEAPSGTRFKTLLRAAGRAFAPGSFLRTAWSMRPVTALVFAAAVALPWYVLVWRRTDGEWVRGFLLEHNVGRAARPMEGHGGGPLLYPLTILFYYPLVTLIGMLPWSLLVVPVVMDTVRRVRRRDPWAAGYVFLACWAGVFMAIFGLARTKLPTYKTPAYPALALLVGAFVHHWSRRRSAAPDKSVLDALRLTAVAGAVVLVALPVGAWLYIRGELWIGAVGLIPLAGALLALRASRGQGGPRAAARAYAGMAVALATCVLAVVLVRVDRYQHSHTVFDAIRARSDAPRIATFNRLEPSWVFYAGYPLTNYKSTTDAGAFLASGADAFVITSEEKLAEIRPGLPPGVGVVARVPYFGRRGKLLVIGHEADAVAARHRTGS